ncbi:MAG: endolytic transglycosylase MltG [Sphingomonadales bacterium]|nr:endolytic transglycosylase MltG [Sphingomonadales bacterium]
MRPKLPHERTRREPTLRDPTLMPRSLAEALEPTRAPKAPRRIRSRSEPGRFSRFFGFANGLLSFLFLVAALVGTLALVLQSSFDQPGPLGHATVAVIPKGEGVYEIASRLEREGIVSDRRMFMAHYLAERMYTNYTDGKPIQLKAGEFEIRKHASLRQVLDTLSEGRAILYRITIPEGLTSAQIVERLKAEPNLEGEIMQMPEEGSLLPDTFKFSRGMARQELIDRMRTEQQRLLATLWEKRQKELPLETPHQAMTLASIVEKETGRADERTRVAGVFINRLRSRMRLQSDPTIVYGIIGGQGSLGRPITRSDIDTKTAYNTYQVDGLPPGPICNPGRSAIEATLDPAKTTDLYFVADGTGGHTFSASLKDHNSAVQTWRKLERDAKAKQAEQQAALPVPNSLQSTEGGADAAKRAAIDVPLPVRKPKR